jgi:glyoxylase I family protein
MVEGVQRPSQIGLGHFGLSVTDLDRSVEFYCEVLGATLVRPPYDGDRPSFSGRMALVQLGSNGLDLYEHAANSGNRFDPACTGLDHVALVAKTYEQLEAWARWLDARGVDHSEIRPGGEVGAMFDFVDPDGVQIEFFFLDRSKLRQWDRWIESQLPE